MHLNHYGGRYTDDFKINNDVLVPRSTIRKAPFPNPVNQARLEEAAEDFFKYQ